MQRPCRQLGSVLLATLCCATGAAGENFFWIVEGGGLHQVSLQNRTSTFVGSLGIPEDLSYGGLSYDASSGELFGVLSGGTRESESRLVTIDRRTGQATQIATVFEVGEWVSTFDISPEGRAYATSIVVNEQDQVSAGSFYEIDLTSGTPTQLSESPTQIATDIVTASDGQLYTIGRVSNQVTGLVTLDPIAGAIDSTNWIGEDLIGDLGDTALGYLAEEKAFFYSTHDLGLVRIDEDTQELSVVEFSPQQQVPNGEHVGTFAPVPEPSACALVLMGMACLGFRTRRCGASS